MSALMTSEIASAALVAVVRRIADEELFPHALETDAAAVLPAARLDVLADAGFYGLVGPREAGGLAADPGTVARVTEALASGCLTTAFVWAQHHNAVATVATGASDEVRRTWLADLCSGRVRAGVAFAGLRRPGPPVLTAEASDTSVVLDGFAPWVTGWGRVDVVHCAARNAVGDVVWLLVDAVEGPSLEIEPLRLAAVNASATVTARFLGHAVARDRVTLIEPYETWLERDASGLRRNGAMALGVAARCTTLLSERAFSVELDACRRALESAEVDDVPAMRARVADLAVRSACALVASGGGKSLLVTEHAQRLVREAVFLLVFGQTPSIKAAELDAYRRIAEAGGAR